MIIEAALIAHAASHVVASNGGWILFLDYGSAAVLGLAAIIAGIWKVIWPIGRFLYRFSKDWDGDPPRPEDGYEGRPGVMKRLALLDYDISSIKKEMHPNHGTSMKDQVNELIDWKRSQDGR